MRTCRESKSSSMASIRVRCSCSTAFHPPSAQSPPLESSFTSETSSASPGRSTSWLKRFKAALERELRSRLPRSGAPTERTDRTARTARAERRRSDQLMSEEDARVTRARRTGGRVGLGIFSLIVVGITAAWTIEIIQQVWFTEPSPSSEACRPGVLGLISAVDRARRAAAEERGEQAAVTRFRTALQPEWNGRAALDRACAGDPVARRALESADGLRYAEENAARSEASDLAERRRATQALSRELAPR